ncbi:hypothetical protein FFLO_03010 [Filobasidium floriforme]|uniref:Glutathione S-transferase n=1 Tax=Filobasidium floriforme TaxID=5210 RepID=A0A8K0JLV1_9TREE|nr:hypothetical protein FFLO_03010 [Filobasidium floriforme]
MSVANKIKLWTAATTTSSQCSILLEELKRAYVIEYEFASLSFSKNEQKEESFLKVNPNGRIPALTDGDHNVFESGAINQWLVEKYDKENKFWFEDPKERSDAFSWIMFFQSGLAPMQGQANHFFRYAPEKIPYGIKRYQDETARLYSVLEDRLAGKRESNGSSGEPRDFVVGAGKGKYSIVDMNAFPWVRLASWAGVPGLERFTHIKAWLERIEAREAVKAGLDIPVKNSFNPNATQEELDAKAKEASKWIMQGQNQKDEKK